MNRSCILDLAHTFFILVLNCFETIVFSVLKFTVSFDCTALLSKYVRNFRSMRSSIHETSGINPNATVDSKYSVSTQKLKLTGIALDNSESLPNSCALTLISSTYWSYFRKNALIDWESCLFRYGCLVVDDRVTARELEVPSLDSANSGTRTLVSVAKNRSRLKAGNCRRSDHCGDNLFVA